MSKKRILLLPFSCLYGLAISVRNFLYDHEVIKGRSFDNVAIVGVGNLSTGGTGKTPMVEFLIENLSKKYQTVVLSRGYGRLTKGFRIGKVTDTHEDIGDEPLQYVTKYDNIHVVVHNDRCKGVENIMKVFPNTQLIILDDCFQHRKIKPHYSILLTSYYNQYSQDFLLPAGSLREHCKNAKRADAIVVSKCDKVLSPILVRQIKESLKILPHQKVYFSSVDFGSLSSVSGSFSEHNPLDLSDKRYCTGVCFSGIANNYLFVQKARQLINDIEVVEFGDHHNYTVDDLKKIKKMYDDNYGNKKFIVTTEKDVNRLRTPQLSKIVEQMPLYYLPIKTILHYTGKEEIISQIETIIKDIKV